MPRTVSINLRGYRRIIRKLERLQESIFSKALMTEIGLLAMTRIKERTIEGKDVNGTPFKPYSPKYAMFREQKGRPKDQVDLTLTGSMLSSMDFDPGSDKVKIYFLNTTDESGARNPKKAFFLNEERNFFALSEEDIEDIVGIVENYYRRLIR